MKEQNIPSTWQKKFRVNTWTKIYRRRIPSFRLLEPRRKKKRKKKEKEKEKKRTRALIRDYFPFFLSFPLRSSFRVAEKPLKMHVHFSRGTVSFLSFPFSLSFIVDSSWNRIQRGGCKQTSKQATNNYGWTRRFEGAAFPHVRPAESRVARKTEAVALLSFTEHWLRVLSQYRPTSSVQPSCTYSLAYLLAWTKISVKVMRVTSSRSFSIR